MKTKESYRTPTFCDPETGICIIPTYCVGMELRDDTN